jgi:hypothetical protein
VAVVVGNGEVRDGRHQGRGGPVLGGAEVRAVAVETDGVVAAGPGGPRRPGQWRAP